MDDTRFYSFVPGLYLSELQKGLQSGHAISDMFVAYSPVWGDAEPSAEFKLYNQWARHDKTIIILNALNSRGVLLAYSQAASFAPHFNLPVVLFCEDEDSLNGAPTATGIVVPKRFYDVKYTSWNTGEERYSFPEKPLEGEESVVYYPGSVEFEFVKFLKGYRLA